MDEEENRTPFIIELLRRFATVFTLAILTMTLSGKFIFWLYPDTQHESALFAFGSGLPYNVILQISMLALILAVLVELVFSEHSKIKVRFIFRYFLLLFGTLLFTAIFSVVFNWISINDPLAWLGFVLASVVCFSIAIGSTFLLLKLQGKKYNKLLAEYKARQLKP